MTGFAQVFGRRDNGLSRAEAAGGRKPAQERSLTALIRSPRRRGQGVQQGNGKIPFEVTLRRGSRSTTRLINLQQRTRNDPDRQQSPATGLAACYRPCLELSLGDVEAKDLGFPADNGVASLAL
jgi:hypothetical protein